MNMISRLLSRPSSKELVIEPMRRKHLAAILQIEDVSYPRPWSPTVFQSEIELARRGERIYIVARSGPRIVGYGGLMLIAGDGHVANIAIDPQCRRQGLGTRLLAELIWQAIDKSCEAITLEVRVSNLAAQAMYQRFGFVAAGVRQRYYENTDDAVVMWCKNIQTADYRQHLRAVCPESVHS